MQELFGNIISLNSRDIWSPWRFSLNARIIWTYVIEGNDSFVKLFVINHQTFKNREFQPNQTPHITYMYILPTFEIN